MWRKHFRGLLQEMYFQKNKAMSKLFFMHYSFHYILGAKYMQALSKRGLFVVCIVVCWT